MSCHPELLSFLEEETSHLEKLVQDLQKAAPEKEPPLACFSEIRAAIKGANLSEDLHTELSGVLDSQNPESLVLADLVHILLGQFSHLKKENLREENQSVAPSTLIQKRVIPTFTMTQKKANIMESARDFTQFQRAPLPVHGNLSARPSGHNPGRRANDYRVNPF